MSTGWVESVRAFYQAHRKDLYTYALSLTRSRDVADEAVQTAFCRVLRRGRAPRELRPYVYRCVRNAAFDILRANSRSFDPESIFITRNGHDPSADIEQREWVEHLLAQLSDDERECIVLKTYSGLTFKEIAHLRQTSLNTAASWYRRGLTKMRALLEEAST